MDNISDATVACGIRNAWQHTLPQCDRHWSMSFCCSGMICSAAQSSLQHTIFQLLDCVSVQQHQRCIIPDCVVTLFQNDLEDESDNNHPFTEFAQMAQVQMCSIPD